MGSTELICWLNSDIDGVFLSEHAMQINDKIIKMLNGRELTFKGDKNIFFMKLLLFLYKNSSV